MARSGSVIRVGIVGLSARGGWAARSHLRALTELRDRFSIVGVSASSPATARESADLYGIPHAFASASAMAVSGEIDLAVVATKVPTHTEVAFPFLEAGIATLVEWPLARSATEGRLLVDVATRTGAVNIVGLQGRSAPVFRQVQELVANGSIGEVLSTALVGSGDAWGGSTTARSHYLSDIRNGATLIRIPFGHALDVVEMCLGQLSSASASIARHRPFTVDVDTGEQIEATAPDAIAIAGHLTTGATVAMLYRGGRVAGSNLSWEIVGTDGMLQITGPSGHLQHGDATLVGAIDGSSELRELPVVARALSDVPSPAHSMVHAYRRLAGDLGDSRLPDFAHAVRLLESLERIERSGEDGIRAVMPD